MEQNSAEDFSQDPLESQLDISSEMPPSTSDPKDSQIPTGIRRRAEGRQQVRFYFGCCRVTLALNPPQHVLVGQSDIWRVHCPRCGTLTEVLIK